MRSLAEASEKGGQPMSQDHPSYANPTIVEALCEVHVRREGGWHPSLPGELFKVIQDEYPAMEPVSEIGLQLEHGPQGMVQRILPPRQRTQFRHASRPLLIQLGEGVFTVNVLAPYPGWSVMQQDVLQAWARARAVLKPASIERVGLRYINRLPCDTGNDAIGNWLKPGPYVPAGLLQSGPGFLLRMHASLDGANRLVVTIADGGNEDEGPGVVFDIDRIVEHGMPPDEETIQREMLRLHQDVWDVFDQAKHTKLERHLEGHSQ
jgi:uncharacterized protein (TIGR04255 family)